jgi:hypothetical protein
MEEFWAKTLSLLSSGKNAEDTFGRKGLKAIEEERTQILKRV